MRTESVTEYDPDYVFPPGATLLETIEDLGMSQAELAERLGKSRKFVNELVKGKAPLASDTALQLERVSGVPASLWLNLEANYRENLERVREQERFAEQIGWLDEFPVKEMVSFGWIEGYKDKILQLIELLNFFGIVSPTQWESFHEAHAGACLRQSQAYQASRNAILAWIRQGELEAQEIACKPFAEEQFAAAVHAARGLTASGNQVTALEEVIQRSADAGVAVVLVRQLSGTRASGVTHWVSPTKAVIQLSLRYKKADQLWFTFFHEAGHLLLRHGKREIFINDGDTATGDENEHAANEYASNFLIPPAEYKRFVADITPGRVSTRQVLDFAAELGIAPGIVVGRLQRERILEYNQLNGLRIKVDWVA